MDADSKRTEPQRENAAAQSPASEPAAVTGAPDVEATVTAPEAATAPREDPAAASARMTPDERALAENNALAQVYDDVRVQSREGVLVAPERWVALGIVPPHMTGEDFEMYVYDRVRMEMAREKEEQSGAVGAASDEAADAEDAASPSPLEAGDPARTTAAHVVSRYRTASHAVGVPHFFASKPAAEDADAEPAVPAAGAAATAAQDVPASAPAEPKGDARTQDGASVSATPDANGIFNTRKRAEEAAPREALYTPVPAPTEPADEEKTPHKRTLEEALASEEDVPDDPSEDEEVDLSVFDDLDLPEGYKMDVVDGEVVLVPTGEKPVPKKLEVDPSHITAVEGRYSYYLYDSSLMTASFARWAFLAAEDDDVVTFAEMAREESRTYPRPMSADTLKSRPFSMDDERIEAAWKQLSTLPDYTDIERTEASNGDVYFYSTKYLDGGYAQSLAEWESVGRQMSV